MVSLRTILSKKMPTGSQPEEPFDAMAFAHQQTEWYNNAEGHLDQEDSYDCPICRNKGYLRVVTEEGGIPNAWMRPCQCQKVRQSIRQMRRSGHALAGRREPHQGRGQPGGGVQRCHRPL